MKKIILTGLAIISLFSCDKEDNNSDAIDTFDLIANNCITIEHSTICFDSVLSDSRCPTGATCVWEGYATVSLKLTTHDNENHKVELNTNPDFSIDTMIGNIYLLLTDLTPYPDINTAIDPKDYKVNITIANIDELKSNAQIIDFNPEKCGCCWGWTIKIGNDTIKSYDARIGKLIGYNINYPVNVYVEKGDLEQTCSGIGYDYYKLKTLIKME